MKAKRYNFAKSYFDAIKKIYEKKVGVPFESLAQGQSFSQLVARIAIEGDEQTIADTIESAMLPNSSSIAPMIVDNDVFNELCIYTMRNAERYHTKDYVVTIRIEAARKKKKNHDAIIEYSKSFFKKN